MLDNVMIKWYFVLRVYKVSVLDSVGIGWGKVIYERCGMEWVWEL